MRMLIEKEGEKMEATIATPKEEADYQCWHLGRNEVIKEYSKFCIQDHCSWESEEETVLVYSVTKKDKSETNINSTVIYDLRTPRRFKSFGCY